MRSADYWRWRAQRESAEPEARPRATTIAADLETSGIRFCPEDGYLLARFLVGSPHAFAIDQCRNCSGAWFDAGEWEALLEGGLAHYLHLVLSEDWQDDLRRALVEAKEHQQWLRQLGEADLARIAETKEWLDAHPKRSELYAFLRLHERAV
jgi:Zn-finger nucleic acid-binding protein